jgi:hypothetical protein
MFIDLKRITVVMILIGVATCVPRAMGQQVSPPRTPAVIKYDGDMASFLATMAEVYEVIIGLEVDPERSHTRVSLYLREPSLADVMNAIVASAPAYQWRRNGEFVEVLPAAEGPSPLDIRVTYFNVKDLTREQAITQLMLLPEVQTHTRMTNLSLRDVGSTLTEGSTGKVSVRLENVVVRDVLNSIAKADGERVWIFRGNSSGSFTISGSPR